MKREQAKVLEADAANRKRKLRSEAARKEARAEER